MDSSGFSKAEFGRSRIVTAGRQLGDFLLSREERLNAKETSQETVEFQTELEHETHLGQVGKTPTPDWSRGSRLQRRQKWLALQKKDQAE